MRVLTIANLKGGTAKTTTAVYLAHAFHKAGEKVLLVDADPQGSAMRWASNVEDAGKEWPIPYASLPMPTIHKQLPELFPTGFDRIIIDTPPFEEQSGVVASALRAADTAIITMSPSMMEYDRSLAIWCFIEELEPLRKKPLNVAVLLNRVVAQASSTHLFREALTEQGKLVLDSQIPRRESITQAFGTPLNDLNNYFDAAMEIRKRGL